MLHNSERDVFASQTDKPSARNRLRQHGHGDAWDEHDAPINTTPEGTFLSSHSR